MSVDFVARALAKQQQSSSGQAQPFTTLATGIPGAQIPSGVKVLQTSGYAADGIGAGIYVSDALATTALATAHPLFCKADAGGRYWRLLPDDNGLIPVVCGGVDGFAGAFTPAAYSGATTFSTAPWGLNGSLSSTIPGPPGTTGNATTFTGTTDYFPNFNTSSYPDVQITTRIKAGTGAFVVIFCTVTGAGNTGVWIDAHTGTIALDPTGTAVIASLGNGWYEVSASFTGLATIGLLNSSTAGGYYGVVGDTFHVWDIAVRHTPGLGLMTTTNAQPGIQAAINYCEAVGAQGTRYDAANYALRRVPRNPSASLDVHSDKTGLLLRTTKSHRFISTCGGTTLWRRDTDGSAMGKAKFDTMSGYGWRGGGIFVEGQVSPPGDVSENSIYLYDIMLDGGITDSSEQNNPYGANFNPTNGDGWDGTDKGIWQSNDRFCGHIVLEGRSGIRYFMGELIYSAGGGVSIADREIRIGPEVELGHTCGSCLNANGHTLRVERCRMHNAYMGFEGWTGHLGGYIKAVISDCNRNTLQGGIPNYGAGNFFEKRRPIANEMPMGHVDLTLRNAGTFEIGSWISGRIESFDCYPNLGNESAFAGGSQDVDLHCITWADQTSVLGGVGIIGGGPGTMLTDRITVRVDCKRTDHAAANDYHVWRPVYGGGSFGPDVTVWIGNTETTGYAPFVPAGAGWDNAIKILGTEPSYLRGGSPFDIEANNNGTIDLFSLGNVVHFDCTHAGTYYANLPTAGIPIGYRLFLYDFTGNAGVAASCRIPASNFSPSGTANANDLRIPPGTAGPVELEFNGYWWMPVSPPSPIIGSFIYDPPSIGSGASATTTVSFAGVLVGDKVTASFSNDLQGLMISAYVSAAGTVTIVLFNPTGAAVDLASGTLKVTAG